MKDNLLPETITLEFIRTLTSFQLYNARLYTLCDILKADHNLHNQMWIQCDEETARLRLAMIRHVGHEKFGWEKPIGKFADIF